MRRLEQLSAWWIWHGRTAGLVIGGLAFVLLSLLTLPILGDTSAQGTVVGFRNVSRRMGETYALVEVSGRQAMVALDVGSACRVGSRIALRKRRAVIGVRYAAPWGCRPA